MNEHEQSHDAAQTGATRTGAQTNATQPGAGRPLLPGEEPWELAGLTLPSRLLLGSSRYPSTQTLLDALDASGTVLRRLPSSRVLCRRLADKAI